MTSRRIENGLRHLAPIIQARRQEREQEGNEKPVGAVYSSNVLTKNLNGTSLIFLRGSWTKRRVKKPPTAT
jgi:hypothetical protein